MILFIVAMAATRRHLRLRPLVGRLAAVALFAAALLLGSLLPGQGDRFVARLSAAESKTPAPEVHAIPFSTADALVLTEEALRGDGILYQKTGTYSLLTLWRPTRIEVNLFARVFGPTPRYRYAIRVEPEGSAKSRIVVELEARGIPEDKLGRYTANSRFSLFGEIDELAAKYPPPSHLPSTGGVKFTVLPNENLRAFAKRVTGNPENWRPIAEDNHLSSPSDVSPFQTLWVRNALLPASGPPAQAASPDTPHSQ